ncbi:MAG: alpha/beta hydrolase, partial [Solobacterium sp.]|nr:alpha/beta hydrolase [Solobacterium sp.]
MSITAKILSSLFLKGDNKRDAGLVTPENIQRIDDLYYGNYQEQILDVYKPKDAIGKLPIIVSVHGGGWVYGDKERYQYYCMDLASRGFAVINFSYRLAPQAKWPSQLEDTNLVFHWIKNHSKEYGFDINHLFALGDSAGAHLLSLYCIFALDKEYAMQYAFKPFDMIPKAIALNCGVYDVTEDMGS